MATKYTAKPAVSEYDSGPPGMHPANLPADRQDGAEPFIKGTRPDLEDETGNPGHRGINPDEALSINRGPNEEAGPREKELAASHPAIGSINMPPEVEPDKRPGEENPEERYEPVAEQHGETPLAGQGTEASINEPPGSTIGSEMPEGETPPPEAALVLSGISPDSIPLQADGLGTFALTATGEGFTEECVIVFNEEDMETTFVSETELTCDSVPTGTAEATVDVEVARGDELSEVVTFDFTAAAGRAAGSKSARKPSKGKRDKAKAKAKKRR